jgi:rubredoxin
MYKKGTAVELQFSPLRLNGAAGDPYWIDLTTEEARSLFHALKTYLEASRPPVAAPLVVSLDDTGSGQPATAAAAQPTGAGSLSTSECRQWVCVICGWVYDEATGCPEEGIAPGTRFADIPTDWRCPLCDVGKEDFALVEF